MFIVTALKAQARVADRVNVFIDGKFRFSLDASQVLQLGVKTGNEYTEAEIESLEVESQYGKTYMRALEYSLVRPRSTKEMRDYLYRKTRDTRAQNGSTKKGVSPEITKRVLAKLIEKGYVDDEKFARFWVENRHLRKGVSKRKLSQELMAKGVDVAIIETTLASSERADCDELKKVIQKKSKRYETEEKLVRYLMSQGFRYDDIKHVLAEDSSLMN